MFYKTSTQQLFLADKNCTLDESATKVFTDKDFGVSVRVPKEFQSKKFSTNSGHGSEIIFTGNSAWCMSVSLIHSIEMEKMNTLIANPMGEVRTSQQLQNYLDQRSFSYKIFQQGSDVFYIVPDTIHGTMGGTFEINVWIAKGDGPIYHLTFDEFTNESTVELLLNSFKFL